MSESCNNLHSPHCFMEESLQVKVLMDQLEINRCIILDLVTVT